MPTLASIHIYPVKSLDPLAVEQAVLLASGALEYDRRYAMCDRHGDTINGKSTPAVHRLRSRFDPAAKLLELKAEGASAGQAFDVDAERPALEAWLSDYFSTPVKWIENAAAGFPDDTESPGPTLIGNATLTEVGRWFGGLEIDDVRRRFRANLEIEGVEPFWEDRLVANGLGCMRFQIGEAEFLGTNPCQRCIVPTRDATTGKSTEAFAKTFAKKREQHLPAWAPAARFDHYYRLAVNTRQVHAQPCTLRVGDEVRILGPA